MNDVEANRDIVTSGLQVCTTRSFHNRPDKIEVAKALIEFNDGNWWGITNPETLSKEIGWGN